MVSSITFMDVVHPEVRAHITSLASALGGFDDDGQYQLGDDGLDVLRDIKKWIRFYDQKLNRMDVARCLAETNLVDGDLLHILATWHENAPAQRFKARVALACFEILTPLTWPLERDPETTTVNHYRHLPVLQLAQVAYKRAIINFDGAQILHMAVRVALPSMAVPLGDRSLRDQGIIKLMLYFLRNVALIEPPPGGQYEGDETQVSRSATIDAFSFQDIFLVLLTLASNMGEDFRTEDTTVLEILFHLFKRVDITKLFMEEKQRSKVEANELTDMMNKEAAMLHAFHQSGPTRHSRFGTMVWIDRGEGKMSTLSGQDALVSAAARELKLDSSKKFRPARRPRRRRDEKLELMGLGPAVTLNARANSQLRKFVEEFLDAGFNPLFQHVRKSIDREAPHVLHYHRSQFLYLVAWFLEAERARQKSRSNGQSKEKPTAAAADDISSFNLVAGVLNQEMFVFLGRALDRAQNDKDWQELTVVMRCFTQILLTVQDMAESKNEDDEEIAENILSRLFYEETTHDAIANIVKNFKDQGYEYLDACTELAHTYMRILEAYSKQNVDLQVRTRRRTRRKKKTAAKAAKAAAAVPGGGGEGMAVDGEGDGPNDNDDDDDDDDESANDEAAAQKTSSERNFDFKRFANRFVAQGAVDTFVQFTSNYNDLTDAQLKRAHRYFYRVAFKQDMSVMLFRVDIVRLLHNMIKGPEPLDRSRAVYRDWEELVKQILRKCVKKIEERPVLIIEMLFSKSASTAHFLEYGYEKQTVKATHPRPGAELEFRHIEARDRQIAVAVAVLLNKNQHELIDWVKKTLHAAETERRAWQAAEQAMAEEAATLPAAEAAVDALAEDATSILPSIEGDPADQPSGPPRREAAAIPIRADGDACKKAMFKNSHLRLLMKLVGFVRQMPLVEETPDAVWVVPAALSAEDLKESLAFINQAEFEPPVFDNDETAEDQLRRKLAARKKAAYDDEEESGADGDESMLFPAGGPTARRVIDADVEGGRKPVRRRRRKPVEEDGEGDEALLDDERAEAQRERAAKRRDKELEKARRIKSALYVHASDDETDEERDREFFAREEAIRQRVRKAVLSSAGGVAGAATTSAAKANEQKSTKRKRPAGLVHDEDDSTDDDNDEDGSSGGTPASSGQRARRRRKRQRSTDASPARSAADAGASDGDGDDEEAEVEAEAVARGALRRLTQRKKRGQLSGFVDSSSEEDEDRGHGKDHSGVDAMDTDDTPLSSSPHGSVVVGDKRAGAAQEERGLAAAPVPSKIGGQGSGGSRGDADDDEDDEDDDVVRPAAGKIRARAKSGFLADSDDE